MGRGVLLAVAVLSLGSAQHPQPKAPSEQNQTAEIQRGAAQITNAVREIRPEKDEGCADRKDKRRSDLCAQWNAVDAARNAAKATWAAVFLSFFGTCLIALTFWETRKATRRQLRAYLILSEMNQPILEVGKKFGVRIVCKNGGQTPAHDATITAYVGARKKPADDSTFDVPALDEEPSIISVGSGETISAQPDLGGIIEQQHFDAYKAGSIGIYTWGTVEYRDIFNKRHKTQFRAELIKGGFSPCASGNSAD
jgi:hypothetical protein